MEKASSSSMLVAGWGARLGMSRAADLKLALGSPLKAQRCTKPPLPPNATHSPEDEMSMVVNKSPSVSTCRKQRMVKPSNLLYQPAPKLRDGGHDFAQDNPSGSHLPPGPDTEARTSLGRLPLQAIQALPCLVEQLQG